MLGLFCAAWFSEEPLRDYRNMEHESAEPRLGGAITGGYPEARIGSPISAQADALHLGPTTPKHPMIQVVDSHNGDILLDEIGLSRSQKRTLTINTAGLISFDDFRDEDDDSESSSPGSGCQLSPTDEYLDILQQQQGQQSTTEEAPGSPRHTISDSYGAEILSQALHKLENIDWARSIYSPDHMYDDSLREIRRRTKARSLTLISRGPSPPLPSSQDPPPDCDSADSCPPPHNAANAVNDDAQSPPWYAGIDPWDLAIFREAFVARVEALRQRNGRSAPRMPSLFNPERHARAPPRAWQKLSNPYAGTADWIMQRPIEGVVGRSKRVCDEGRRHFLLERRHCRECRRDTLRKSLLSWKLLFNANYRIHKHTAMDCPCGTRRRCPTGVGRTAFSTRYLSSFFDVEEDGDEDGVRTMLRVVNHDDDDDTDDDDEAEEDEEEGDSDSDEMKLEFVDLDRSCSGNEDSKLLTEFQYDYASPYDNPCDKPYPSEYDCANDNDDDEGEGNGDGGEEEEKRERETQEYLHGPPGLPRPPWLRRPRDLVERGDGPGAGRVDDFMDCDIDELDLMDVDVDLEDEDDGIAPWDGGFRAPGMYAPGVLDGGAGLVNDVFAGMAVLA